MAFEPFESRLLLATVELVAVADNTLYESATGNLSNGAGEHFFVGQTINGQLRRGMVRFQVAGQIPDGATINSASLSLHVSRVRSGTELIALHRVLASWGEGTSDAIGEEGGGAAAVDGDATWLHRSFDSVLWNNAGGDFDVTASATAQVGGVGDYVWSTTEMAKDIQSWINDPASDFGWLLKGTESANGTSRRFDSRENPTGSFRPRLTIDFTPPAANNPPTAVMLDNSEVPENADTANPLVVGTLSASDTDDGDSHLFTIVAGVGDADNSNFQIVGDQLQFNAGVALDHETKETYTVRVRATDSGGLHVDEAFVVSITDVNEPPLGIALSSSIVAHNTPGFVVGSLSAVDPESGDSHMFSVSDDRFEATGGTLKLKAGISVDSEVELKIDLEVTATDSGTPPASFTESFTLTLTAADHPFQNPLDANDANGDGFVSPIDALIVINFLNEGNFGGLPDDLGNPPVYLDVNGDNFVSPIDVLHIINFLNDNLPASEGEGVLAITSAEYEYWCGDVWGLGRGRAGGAELYQADELIATSVKGSTNSKASGAVPRSSA